jgi:hypothetical protein
LNIFSHNFSYGFTSPIPWFLRKGHFLIV